MTPEDRLRIYNRTHDGMMEWDDERDLHPLNRADWAVILTLVAVVAAIATAAWFGR